MKLFGLHPNIQIRLAVEFLTTLATMAVLPFMAIYFAGKIGETVVGFMLIVIVLAGVTGGFVGGFFSDKLGRKKMMIIADAVTCLMFLCIAFVNSPWVDLPYVTFLLFVVTMFASGIMAPVARAMMIAALFVTLGAWLPFWLIGIFFVVMGGSSLFLFHRIMPGLKERRAMQKGA